MKKLGLSSRLYLAVILILIYWPIFYLIFYSFNSSGTMQSFESFTLEHFITLFSDSRLMLIVVQTFLLAFLSSLFATIIGTMGAMYLQESSKKVHNSLLSFNNILLVSPDVIIGASFLILFTMIGLQLGFFSVLISHIAFSIPIVVLMVLPRYKEMDRSLIDAAEDLGANRWQILKEVILPFLTPGILAGFFMAFTYSMDDFAVTFFVTGNGFSTLAVEIYSRARQGISLEINALSALIFLFSIILVIAYYFINRESKVKEI
ncbi:MAG: ABC transporter permease [Lactovum sp.]